MDEATGTLKDCMLEIGDSHIVAARRSIGSIIQIYFDHGRGLKERGGKSKYSILVEFSSWSIATKGLRRIDQDCEVGMIDRYLPKIVGMRVESVRLNQNMDVNIGLNNGKIVISPLLDGLPDDQAWVLFRNLEDSMMVEAWTIMCNSDISFWRGGSLRTAS